jgi:hypothetical protein
MSILIYETNISSDFCSLATTTKMQACTEMDKSSKFGFLKQSKVDIRQIKHCMSPNYSAITTKINSHKEHSVVNSPTGIPHK